MNDMAFFEMQTLRTLTGVGDWITVAILACYFQLVIFRPDRIRSPGIFFWAVLTLAASFVAPSLCTALFALYAAGISGGGNETAVLAIITLSIPSLTIAVSFVLAIVSILPRRTRPVQFTSAGPAHPLD